jgi:hypothetical protein
MAVTEIIFCFSFLINSLIRRPTGSKSKMAEEFRVLEDQLPTYLVKCGLPPIQKGLLTTLYTKGVKWDPCAMKPIWHRIDETTFKEMVEEADMSPVQKGIFLDMVNQSKHDRIAYLQTDKQDHSKEYENLCAWIREV